VSQLARPVQDLNWLITNFVERVASVAHAGLTSLTQGAARVFEGGPVSQTVVEMERGLLLVMAISDGSSLAVLAAADCDMGLVAYEMALLVERVGRALTPDMRGVLRSEGSR
jgi:predicted regulator of Ras-like GTPase activity (Roadblock/LC7/MglB family)